MDKIDKQVYYKYLKPHELIEKIRQCPVAYLPLGTLEFHGFHLPLGADGLQSEAFFTDLANEIGGVVLPMLFLGPSPVKISGDIELHGSDIPCDMQLPGSLYRVSDETFSIIIEQTVRLTARAGFKILVAHGHGPSNAFLFDIKEHLEKKYNIIIMNCWHEIPDRDHAFMDDHAAANETSIMMHYYENLVDMDLLPKDLNEWPLAVAGEDPRIKASVEIGTSAIKYNLMKMKERIQETLNFIHGE